MKYVICCVRDRGIDAFGVPFFMAAIGQATRSFADEVNTQKEGNMLSKHPEDFDLYHLGYYDDSAARFELLDSPRVLVRGTDVLK